MSNKSEQTTQSSNPPLRATIKYFKQNLGITNQDINDIATKMNINGRGVFWLIYNQALKIDEICSIKDLKVKLKILKEVLVTNGISIDNLDISVELPWIKKI